MSHEDQETQYSQRETMEIFALQMARKDQEIARLRRDIAQANVMCKSDELREEVSRLKAELAEFKARNPLEANIQRQVKIIDRLESELAFANEMSVRHMKERDQLWEVARYLSEMMMMGPCAESALGGGHCGTHGDLHITLAAIIPKQGEPNAGDGGKI